MGRLLCGALLLAACAAPATETAAPTEPAAARPTTTPTPTPSPTPIPSNTPPAPTLTPTPPILTLAEIQPGEQLQRLADFPIPRASFGVRMAFSPVRPVLYHSGVGLQVQGYDYSTGQVVLQIQDFQDRTPGVLAVSPDGSSIVADDGPALGVWDAATGARIRTVPMPAPIVPVSGGFEEGGTFYADDEGGRLAQWDTAEWQEVARLTYSGRNDGAFVLPDNGSVVILFRDQRELSILDWTGQLIRTVPVNAQLWRLVSVSPQGDRAAVHVDKGLGTEGVLITDLAEGGTAFRIPLLNIRALAMSSDWRALAVVDASEELRLFDPSAGRQLMTQALEALQIDGLAISPDGTLLGVYLRREGEDSGRIQVWGRQQQ